VLAVTCLARSAAAQSSLQVPIQFDFLNPSARSLALGSAFVGLADDATAALVNPAGLIALTRKEVSIEGRYRGLEQPFLVGGRLSGPVTGIGQDTVAGPEYTTLNDGWTGLSYLSFVYPHKKFRFAAFRHEPLSLDQHYQYRGVFQNHGFENRDGAFDALRTLSVVTYGASGAVEWRGVSFGAGLLVQQFSLGFEFDRFARTDLYLPADPNLHLFHFSQTGDDTGVGAAFGVIVPFEKKLKAKIVTTKIGASYKRAPRFSFSSSSSGPAALVPPQPTAEFKVPDVLAAGASVAIGTTFLITSEYTRVYHSQLFTEYIQVLVDQGESRARANQFTIADANEFHLGAEYLLPFAGGLGIRGGLWFDPDHSVHYAPTPANDLLDERLVASLSSGKDLWHYTFGGMVSVRSNIDISAAVDYSSRTTVFSTSAAIRF